MKRLFLAITFGVAGLTGSINANTIYSDLDRVATKCYKLTQDDFGNPYYVEVPCPPIIIIN